MIRLRAARRDREEWWQEFFTERFASAYLRDRREGDRIAAGLAAALSLGPGSLVFDQCCGVGRVSLAMLARGVRVVGVDASVRYVREARSAASESADADDSTSIARFFADDAFSFVSPEPCDAAFNWHTSFGYSPDDDRNLSMLRAAYDSLRAGGGFILDYPDMDGVRAHFRPRTVRTIDTPEGRLRVTRDARLDESRGMLVDRWRLEREGSDGVGVGDVEESWGETRLYDSSALRRLLHRAGFETVERLSPLDFGYSERDHRVVLRGRRAP